MIFLFAWILGVILTERCARVASTSLGTGAEPGKARGLSTSAAAASAQDDNKEGQRSTDRLAVNSNRRDLFQFAHNDKKLSRTQKSLQIPNAANNPAPRGTRGEVIGRTQRQAGVSAGIGRSVPSSRPSLSVIPTEVEGSRAVSGAHQRISGPIRRADVPAQSRLFSAKVYAVTGGPRPQCKRGDSLPRLEDEARSLRCGSLRSG